MSILKRMDDIIAWENGELSEERTISLFQYLLDEGHCWRLQGFYGSFALQLMQEGLIFERDEEGDLITSTHPSYRFHDFVNIQDLPDTNEKEATAEQSFDENSAVDEDIKVLEKKGDDEYRSFYSILFDDDDIDDSY